MGLEAGEATARVHRVIRRLAYELFWLRAEQVALRELDGRDHVGLDFFRIAYTGIQGDWLIRLVRVLEPDGDVASWWYLDRTIPRDVQEALAPTGVDRSELESLAQRIRAIRNKVFVHIDKHGVFEPDAVYEKANITGQETERTIEALWVAINKLHRKAFEKEYQREPDYGGADIGRLHAFYMTQIAPKRTGTPLE